MTANLNLSTLESLTKRQTKETKEYWSEDAGERVYRPREAFRRELCGSYVKYNLYCIQNGPSPIGWRVNRQTDAMLVSGYFKTVN